MVVRIYRIRCISRNKCLKRLKSFQRPRSYAFRPSVEIIKEGALLPDLPSNLWKNVSRVSMINGINENEGNFFLRDPSAYE